MAEGSLIKAETSYSVIKHIEKNDYLYRLSVKGRLKERLYSHMTHIGHMNWLIIH